eukprot:scaffold19014_cov90-Phaeocystis_antarctica.AAC.3
MASSSTAPPSGALERLPASGTLYWEYLQALPNGAVIAMDLQSDSPHWAELGERPTVKFWEVSKEGAVQQTFVVAFGDGFWLGFPPGKPWAMCPESR